MKRSIHLAAQLGQFRVLPAADHPGIPFGATACAGNTRNASFSLFLGL